MRRLLIDIGNSRIKWCFAEKKQLTPQQALSWQFDSLENIFSTTWNYIPSPDEIWVANVAGQRVAEKLTQWTQRHWQLTPFFAQTHNQCCHVINGYQQPQQLGIDRWLAMIAARQLYQGTACIVSCGTAITLDVIHSDGQHVGGLITLGLGSTRKTLLQKAHALNQLTDVNLSSTQNFLANNTHQGVAQGTLVSVLGLLEYTVKQLERNEENVMLFLTGGDATQLIPFLSIYHQHEPNLVLQGLHIVAEHA